MSFLVIAAIPVLCCGSNAGLPLSSVTSVLTFEKYTQANAKVFRSLQKEDKPTLTLAQGGYYNPYYRYPPRYNPYYAPRYNPYYPRRYNPNYSQRNSAQYRHYLRMQSLRYQGQINTNIYNSRQRANDRQHKRFIESIRK